VEDTLQVKKVDTDNKHFDRVSRITAEGTVSVSKIELDINSEVFPMREGEYYKFGIASAQAEDGSADDFDICSYMKGEQSAQSQLFEQYDYVCHGKVFNYQVKEGAVIIYASFGGLLLSIRGELKNLKSI